MEPLPAAVDDSSVEDLTAVDRLVAQAEFYAAAFHHGHLPGPPALRTTVVTCMDARINPYGLLGLTEGDAHVLRNAGGSATDDVLRSLAVSQRQLETREVAVVQHTCCGMTAFDGDEFRSRVVSETGAEPPWPSAGTFRDVEQNVRDSVARIQGDPALPHRDRVRGFVYDVLSGTLTEVRQASRPQVAPAAAAAARLGARGFA